MGQGQRRLEVAWLEVAPPAAATTLALLTREDMGIGLRSGDVAADHVALGAAAVEVKVEVKVEEILRSRGSRRGSPSAILTATGWC